MGFKRLLRAAVIVGVTAAAATGAASASAASLANAVVSPTPEQSIPVSVRFSGASDVPGSNTALQAVARPGGSIPCQPTLADDTTAAAANAQVMTNGSPDSILPAAEPFSQTDAFTPTQPGRWTVCSWISETAPDSGVVTVYGPISTTVQVRMPQVAKLAVTLPSHPVPGKAFPVRWSTKTDQNLSLYGMIAHGRSCQLNQSVELGHNPLAVNIEAGATVYGGPKPTSVPATVTTPGQYVLCTWLEGPLTNEVVAHRATTFTVAGPRAHKRR